MEIPKEYRDRFKNHRVKFHRAVGDYEELLWSAPEQGSIDSVHYIFHHPSNTLMIRGDLGECMFGWPPKQPLGLEWVSRRSLNYIAEKCLASETGRTFRAWDRGYIRQEWKKYLKAHIEDLLKTYGAEETKRRVTPHRWELECCKHYMDSALEWRQFLDDRMDFVNTFFGDDAIHDLWDLGYTHHPRFLLVMYGLQLAMEQKTRSTKTGDGSLYTIEIDFYCDGPAVYQYFKTKEGAQRRIQKFIDGAITRDASDWNSSVLTNSAYVRVYKTSPDDDTEGEYKKNGDTLLHIKTLDLGTNLPSMKGPWSSEFRTSFNDMVIAKCMHDVKQHQRYKLHSSPPHLIETRKNLKCMKLS